METLSLNDAALLLHIHPQTLLQKARDGVIPAAKPGKCWVFIKCDLLNWLREQYHMPRQDVGHGENLCFTKERIVRTGGLNTQTRTVKEYADLLKPPIEKRRKN